MPKLSTWKWPNGQCIEGTIVIQGVNTLCRRLPFAPEYFVTPDGAIISLTAGVPKWMTQSQTQSGKRVHIIINKRSKSFRIEELVAYCYLNWKAGDRKPTPIDGNWNNTHRDNLTLQPKSAIQRARQIRAQRIEQLFTPSVKPIQLPLTSIDEQIMQKRKFIEQTRNTLDQEVRKETPDYAIIKTLTSAISVSKSEIETLSSRNVKA